MSDTIIMRHPTLPSGQEIEVQRDAMPHYTAAGWQLVPAEELERRAAAKAQAEAEARAAEEAERQPDVSLDEAYSAEMAEDQAEYAETADEPEQSEPAEAPTERPARSRRAHDKKTEEN